MGNFRTQPQTKKHTIQKSANNGVTYAVSHMCGWRLYMQDAHISIPNFAKKQMLLFGVFDGHGGPQVSTFVERHFPQQLENNKSFQKGNYQAALKETFLYMDTLLRTDKGKNQVKNIQKQMKQKQNGPGYQQDSHAGCTANVCLITKDTIYIANAGDSRAVASIKNSGQNYLQLSKDHKPEDKIQIDRITKAGGSVSYGRVNGNLNLSRAIGDLQYKSNTNITAEEQMITANPDIKTIPLDKVDYIIMGCDGIWQTKSSQQMINWINKRIDNKKSLSTILEELLDQLVAKDSGGEYGMDNMSAILIKFQGKKK